MNTALTNTLNNTRHYAYLLYQSDGTFKCSKCGRRYTKVSNLTQCIGCKAEIINSERSINDA